MSKKYLASNRPYEVSDFESKFIEQNSPTIKGEKVLFPTPSMNPTERARLRTMHRNEQHLYRVKSAKTQAPLISIYPPETKSPILSRDDWFADDWDAIDFGSSFDFSRGFFEQFAELQARIPRAATVTLNNENCDFTTGTAFSKDCYLINSSEHCRDCYYSKLLQNCTDVIDSAYCYDSELLYECFNVRNCYDCRWLYNSQQCQNCWFSDDLRNCSNCLLCTNLVGQKYCILNQKVSREEYEEQIQLILSDRKELERTLEQFKKIRGQRYYRYAEIVNCENSSGDFLRNSKNCHNCYDVVDCQDCLHVQVAIQGNDLVDCSNMYLKPSQSYQVLGTIGTSNVHFSLYAFHSSDLLYCEQCFSCQSCFACVGLRNKKYCVFNHQLDRQTYESTVQQIIHKMRETGEWGSFFPARLSPFAYNTSVAQEYSPVERSEALAKNWRWEEPTPKDYKPATAKPPQHISETTDAVREELFACAESGKNYRIQAGELALYRKMQLPIPQFCPDVRYNRRLEARKSRQLWERVCSKCNVDLISPFAPDSQERVLCEKDYLELVS